MGFTVYVRFRVQGLGVTLRLSEHTCCRSMELRGFGRSNLLKNPPPQRKREKTLPHKGHTGIIVLKVYAFKVMNHIVVNPKP